MCVNFSSGLLGHISELLGILSNRDITCTPAEGSQGQPVAVGCVLDSSGQQLKRGLLMAGIGISGSWSLAFGGSAVSQMREVQYSYQYVFVQ